MRFIVYGAGAIGGTIGSRLHQSGHEVVLIARGAHYQALRDGGLLLATPEGRDRLEIPVVDDPGRIEFGAEDIVVLAMKTQDTQTALHRLAGLADPELAIMCAQNGVENERIALRSWPNVYGVYVILPATHLEPGVVEATSSPVSGILDVGRYPSGADATTEAVAGALGSSTFSARSDPAIMRWKYAKLLTNLGNAVEAAAGRAARDSGLSKRARDEARACLAAAGIEVASGDEVRARTDGVLRMQPVGGEDRQGGSSWQSLSRRTGTIEADWLNGEIVLLGRLHGIATPVNALLQRVVNDMARSAAPPGSISVDQLMAQLI